MQAASRVRRGRQVRPVLIAIEPSGDFETSRFNRPGGFGVSGRGGGKDDERTAQRTGG